MTQSNKRFSRRRFITTSLGGLASAGLVSMAPRSVFGQETPTASPEPEGEIITRTLGRTGIEVPIVSMGVMNAGAPDVVSASYELGVRHFDTAARYQYGRNEQMVGDVIRRLGVRDHTVIATKIMRPVQRGRSEETPADVAARFVELCEGSLRRLKTDYVDILYIHSVASADEVNDEAMMEAGALLKKQGKVRALGVSTHRAMADVINEVTRTGFYDVVLTAINVAMADDEALLTAIEQAAAKGVGIVAMKTQAGGARLPNPESLQNHSSTTVATAALKWALRNEHITTAIPGYDNFQHMREDVSVARNLEYTPEEEAFLGDNNVKLSFGFCHQCARCVPDCPWGVEIPSLMRSYMYAAQYGNFHEARFALQEAPSGQGLDQCNRCEVCRAQCVNTVDIAHRIDTLKQIYA